MSEKLTTPWFRVVLDDDTEHFVRASNIDLVAFDLERRRRPHWPAVDDAPMLASTFYAWHALTRTDAIAMPFADFQTRALQVEGIQSKDYVTEVDPTQTAAEPE